MLTKYYFNDNIYIKCKLLLTLPMIILHNTINYNSFFVFLEV